MLKILIFLCYLIFFCLHPNTILLLFFVLFSLIIAFKNILMVPLLIKNTTLMLAPDISKGIAMTVLNEQTETPLHAPDKTTRVLPAYSIDVIY